MAEEITNYKAPIAKVPQQQLLAGQLQELRRQRTRLRKDEAVRENQRQQTLIIEQLVAMGREDLTR